MKHWNKQLPKLALFLLTVVGVGRSLAFITLPGELQPVALRSLAISPLPRVFDRPHYFMQRSATYRYKDGVEETLPESALHNYFGGWAWHHKIISRHMFLYGYRRDPSLFDRYAQAVYCKGMNGRPVAKIEFHWAPLVQDSSLTEIRREVLCP